MLGDVYTVKYLETFRRDPSLHRLSLTCDGEYLNSENWRLAGAFGTGKATNQVWSGVKSRLLAEGISKIAISEDKDLQNRIY